MSVELAFRPFALELCFGEQNGFLFIRYHMLPCHHVQARVALSTVLRPVLVSYGRPQTLTPCNSETVVTIDTKICRIDYVAEISECAKIGCNRLCSCLSPYV